MRSLTDTIGVFRPRPMAPLRPGAASMRRRDDRDIAAGILFPELEKLETGGRQLFVTWGDGPLDSRDVEMRTPAAARKTSFARLAEGLLRGPALGRSYAPCLSGWVAEIAGPTSLADAANPGRVLSGRGWESPELLSRAASARAALVQARVGGSWWQRDAAADLPAGDGLAVVALSDQAEAGDDARPGEMLDQALRDNQPRKVVILTPGTIAQRLKPLLREAASSGATVLSRPIDPWLLLERASRVYSDGAELGFFALLAGVPVVASGAGFYTGWGVTEDTSAVDKQPFRRSIDEIFAGACLVATRYRDPFRNRPTSFEAVLDILVDWRRAEEANRRVAVCVGMSFWKRRRIADFLRSSSGVPAFCKTTEAAIRAARSAATKEPAAIAGWASRLPDGLAEAAEAAGIPLVRVEDGFIRSVGLGSDFLPAASLVFDSRGMYFDPRVRSDLEILLLETDFPPELTARARLLAAQLVARGITKYNLAGGDAAVELPSDRRCLLVPGQVEDDLSIRLGGGDIRTNLALLAQARAANPDAFIIYKPHPDVLAGHRVGAVPETEARRFADAIVAGGSTAALLDRIDELHTMTSLAGFEALLRGRRVVVYGKPFYAGWGLTVDCTPIDRGRNLTLDELVAGALILYPRYLDPLTRLPCGPEIVIERLDHPELWRPGLLVQARRLQGRLARRWGELRGMFS
jgi:capsular polysaccharide export protein